MKKFERLLTENPIVSSIVASILFMVFFQPIVEATSAIIGKLASATGFAFLNYIYKQAAALNGHSLLLSMSLCLCGIIPGVMVVALANALGLVRIVKTDKKVSNAKRPIQFFYLFTTITVLFLIVIMLVSPVLLRSQFENEMDIIAPYISDEDYKQLASQWRLMDSSDDCVRITQIINEIKAENGIVQ